MDTPREIESHPPTPINRQNAVWFPALVLAFCAGLGWMAVAKHYAQAGAGGSQWVLLLSIASLAYGCLMGYANQQRIWRRVVAWPPAVIALLALGVEIWRNEGFGGVAVYLAILACIGVVIRTFGWLAILGIVFLFAPFVFFAFCFLLFAAGARGSLWDLYLLPLAGTYLAAAVGLFFGLVLRFVQERNTQGSAKALPGSWLPRQYSLLSLFGVTTVVAFAFGAVSRANLSPLEFSGALVSVLAGAVVAWAVSKLFRLSPEPRTTLDELHDFRNRGLPLVRCPSCGHLTRSFARSCVKCQTAYPADRSHVVEEGAAPVVEEETTVPLE